MWSGKDESKACFQLPARTKYNSYEAMFNIWSVLPWLLVLGYHCDFPDKWCLGCNVHVPGTLAMRGRVIS